MEHHKAWRTERAAAEALLATYNCHVMTSLSGMLMHWLFESDATSDAPGPKHRAELAFILATRIHALVQGRPDPITGTVVKAPLGTEIAIAAAVATAPVPEAADALQSLCALRRHVAETLALPPPATPERHTPPTAAAAMSGIWSRTRSHRSGVGAGVSAGGDSADGYLASSLASAGMNMNVDQVAVPACLHADYVLTAADAAEVAKHIFAGDEATATKLVLILGAKHARDFAVRLTRPPQLDVDELQVRLEALQESVPTLLYQAMIAMGCIGPAVYGTSEPGACAPVAGFLRYVGESVAMRFARRVETLCEHEP